jgi:hypothetical protein
MPVLFLTLAALIFFILVVTALAIAQMAEKRESRRLSLYIPGRPFCVICVAQAFEEDSAILWETQVPALQSICSGGGRGVTVDRVRRAYNDSSKRYPELYDGTSFEHWLRFLADAELIGITDDRISITPQGRQFLKYRIIPKPAVAA